MFDGRTSDICKAISLANRVYRYDDPAAPVPPLHWGCRTTPVPVVDWKGLGLPEPDAGTRSSATGQVPAEWDYERWLRTAPAETQAQALGRERARLFREGRLSLRDAILGDGRRVTLRELAAAA